MEHNEMDGTEELKAENNRLRAIVERLPKTADGVYVIPGEDTVWKWFADLKKWIECEVEIPQPYNEAAYEYVSPQGVGECYSTRAAAIAAKGA